MKTIAILPSGAHKVSQGLYTSPRVLQDDHQTAFLTSLGVASLDKRCIRQLADVYRDYTSLYFAVMLYSHRHPHPDRTPMGPDHLVAGVECLGQTLQTVLSADAEQTLTDGAPAAALCAVLTLTEITSCTVRWTLRDRTGEVGECGATFDTACLSIVECLSQAVPSLVSACLGLSDITYAEATLTLVTRVRALLGKYPLPLPTLPPSLVGKVRDMLGERVCPYTQRVGATGAAMVMMYTQPELHGTMLLGEGEGEGEGEAKGAVVGTGLAEALSSLSVSLLDGPEANRQRLMDDTPDAADAAEPPLKRSPDIPSQTEGTPGCYRVPLPHTALSAVHLCLKALREEGEASGVTMMALPLSPQGMGALVEWAEAYVPEAISVAARCANVFSFVDPSDTPLASEALGSGVEVTSTVPGADSHLPLSDRFPIAVWASVREALALSRECLLTMCDTAQPGAEASIQADTQAEGTPQRKLADHASYVLRKVLFRCSHMSVNLSAALTVHQSVRVLGRGVGEALVTGVLMPWAATVPVSRRSGGYPFAWETVARALVELGHTDIANCAYHDLLTLALDAQTPRDTALSALHALYTLTLMRVQPGTMYRHKAAKGAKAYEQGETVVLGLTRAQRDAQTSASSLASVTGSLSFQVFPSPYLSLSLLCGSLRILGQSPPFSTLSASHRTLAAAVMRLQAHGRKQRPAFRLRSLHQALPALLPSVLESLSRPSPATVPVLVFLASLDHLTSAKVEHTVETQLVPGLCLHLGSAEYVTRAKAARAVANLNMLSLVETHLRGTGPLSANALHGLLLCRSACGASSGVTLSPTMPGPILEAALSCGGDQPDTAPISQAPSVRHAEGQWSVHAHRDTIAGPLL
ncbi:hypothetical protein KIPB_003567 [Kipferlia bialata]|uniref:Uncharacterized protein n=1 Tax=Kipferlia bialata TaxID=797122 RepID=A0A9K3CU30_9EUKA|nr:hypothetical protein KIPB_003567 [Kipferlia bialata]|eukprot:g3567.t1